MEGGKAKRDRDTSTSDRKGKLFFPPCYLMECARRLGGGSTLPRSLSIMSYVGSPGSSATLPAPPLTNDSLYVTVALLEGAKGGGIEEPPAPPLSEAAPVSDSQVRLSWTS